MGTLLLAGLLSLCIGVVLGLLGGGGGILAVPLLVYGVGVGTKSAIAMSLFFVGATSAIGTALAARDRRVRWKMGGLFGAGSMSGAFVGGALAQRIPERLLLGGLAAVMLLTGFAMLRGQGERAERAQRSIATLQVLAIGAAVGVLSGLVGAGGGFLIVPALTLFGGVAIRDAIGTSLFIISIQSFAGFAGHVGHVELEYPLLGLMTAAAIVGMVAGRGLGKRVAAEGLKRAFAGLVLTTGSFMLGRQLLPTWIALVLALAFALSLTLFLRRRRAAAASTP